MYAVFRVLTLKDYVVIIAKRIHLFPYRTQKLSSLALMVLGGRLPGRVRHSHVNAEVAELADAQDLKSCGTYLSYRFDSGLRHQMTRGGAVGSSSGS